MQTQANNPAAKTLTQHQQALRSIRVLKRLEVMKLRSAELHQFDDDVSIVEAFRLRAAREC